LSLKTYSFYFLLELLDDAVDVVRGRSFWCTDPLSLFELLFNLEPLWARAAAAAAASSACFLLSINDCSKRSSSSFISGLVMSRALPVPKMLEAFDDPSGSAGTFAATGTVRGKSFNWGRPSSETGVAWIKRLFHIKRVFLKKITKEPSDCKV
jgi:hypothetical protein